MEKDLERLELACTYMKNNQNISAHNLFMSLAQKELKNQSFKAGLYLILASHCKTRNNKDGKAELEEAAKLYLKLAKNDARNAGYAYQCAARCLLKVGNYKDAMKYLDEARKHVYTIAEEKRPIVVVDDSPAIVLRLKNFLKQLGYDEIQTASDGKSAIEIISNLIKASQNPVILLDMDLPDLSGDVIARKFLETKPDLSIILITADEKSTPRVKKTIGFGSAAFIQKPFTINELKNALDVAKQSELK